MSSSRLPSGSRKYTLRPSPRAPCRATGPSPTATPCRSRCSSAPSMGPRHAKQRSLFPGWTGTLASGAGATAGLVMAGTTGEASPPDAAEKIGLSRLAVAGGGDRASAVAGTGSNDTRHSVHLTEVAAEAGVDAVLAVTPYYNRPPRDGL